MNKRLFITATDTDAGKTYVSVSLLNFFNKQGLSTLGVKPIASGSVLLNGHYQNADALQLQQASSIQLPYAEINPFAFAPPIAPHLAARMAQCDLNVERLQAKMAPAFTTSADILLIEGVGGWSVPLNDTETMADFVTREKLPIILVIKIKLGCLNHALLTAQAIKQQGGDLIGWIANCAEPDMPYLEENIQTLQTWIPNPCLGRIELNGEIKLNSISF